MAATLYSVLRGSFSLVSVLDSASNPLTPFADVAPGFFSARAPSGTGGDVSVWLYLSGFTSADPADSNVRVRVRLPRPIVVDDAGAVSPRLNLATPMWSLSPANNENGLYYDTLKPVVFGSGLDFTPGAVNREQDVSIDCAALGGSSVDMMLRIDFPNVRGFLGHFL